MAQTHWDDGVGAKDKDMVGKAYTKNVKKIKIIKVMVTTNCDIQIKKKRRMDLAKPTK